MPNTTPSTSLAPITPDALVGIHGGCRPRRNFFMQQFQFFTMGGCIPQPAPAPTVAPTQPVGQCAAPAEISQNIQISGFGAR